MSKQIPEGYHTLTPSFTFQDSHKAIAFYQKAFGAQLLDVFPAMDGKGVMHATIKIGDSIVMMGDECPGEKPAKSAETTGSCPVSFYLYVEDADETFRRAIEAGGREEMPVMDMFWGDRCGTLKDPFGYTWMIATFKHALTKEQVQEGAKAFFEKMSKE